jgi:hypothetical protein
MADEGRGDRVWPAADLPAAGSLPAAQPVPAAKDLVRIHCGNGSARRDGPWVVPRRIEVKANMGSITARPPRRRLRNWLLRRPRYALPAAR